MTLEAVLRIELRAAERAACAVYSRTQLGVDSCRCNLTKLADAVEEQAACELELEIVAKEVPF